MECGLTLAFPGHEGESEAPPENGPVQSVITRHFLHVAPTGAERSSFSRFATISSFVKERMRNKLPVG